MENKKSMNLVWAVIICLVLVGVFIFISINNKTNMVTENDNTEINNTVNGTDNNTAPTGEVAKAGDMVAMNYTGRLEDGTVFDSNVDPKFGHVESFTFTLGAGQVIAGWDKGIVGMHVGEKKTLTIPPEDGYGATGAGGIIPPNATLIFDVELVSINK
jgi:FKBP-type peptidyl-prolyl cis-trans isomerase